jgi:acetone carboxylase gamma subunit
MRLIVALPVFVALLDVASAALHNAGICVDWTNDAAVYNKDATAKACDAYKRRNTGDKQWDKCPDCGLVRHINTMKK